MLYIKSFFIPMHSCYKQACYLYHLPSISRWITFLLRPSTVPISAKILTHIYHFIKVRQTLSWKQWESQKWVYKDAKSHVVIIMKKNKICSVMMTSICGPNWKTCLRGLSLFGFTTQNKIVLQSSTDFFERKSVCRFYVGQVNPQLDLYECSTSLFGAFLEIILQSAEVWLKVLTATHIKQLLLIAAQLFFLTLDLCCEVTPLLFSRRQFFATDETLQEFKSKTLGLLCTYCMCFSNTMALKMVVK